MRRRRTPLEAAQAQEPRPCPGGVREEAERKPRRRRTELLRKTEAERQKIIQEWKELWEFLEEQKQLLLGWLAGDLVVRRREEEESWPGDHPAAAAAVPERGGEKLQLLQVVSGPRELEDAPSPKAEDAFLELEVRLGHFSEKRTILQEVLSRFRESLQRELENLTGLTGPDRSFISVPISPKEDDSGRLLQPLVEEVPDHDWSPMPNYAPPPFCSNKDSGATSCHCPRVSPPKPHGIETGALELVQGLLAFEDVAVRFTEEEWFLLEAPQRTLYRDVMQENYENVTTLVLAITKPEVVSQLEHGGELWTEAGQSSKEKTDHLSFQENFCRGDAERARGNEPENFELALLREVEEVPSQAQEEEEEEVPETQLGLEKPLGNHPGERVQESAISVGTGKNLASVNAELVTQEVCSLCGKRFSNRASLVRHRRIHTGEKSHICTDCGKSFNKRSNLITHQRIHTGEKPYKCSDCGKNFSLSSSLVRHQRIHTGEKPYQCLVCERRFNQKPSLVVHERTHTREKPYKCLACEKSYSHVTSLIAHEKIHREEKPYKCADCGKRFSFSSQLITHQRIHAEEKPYKCSVCERGFSRPSSLIVHERIHTGEKPYKCTACEKSFPSNSSLVRHQLTHMEEEKPCACGDCGKSSAGLRMGLQRIHAVGESSKCTDCEQRWRWSPNSISQEKKPYSRPSGVQQQYDVETVDPTAVRTEALGTAFRGSTQPLHYQINSIEWE